MSIADSPELNPAQLTVFICGSFDRYTLDGRWYSKRDGGGSYIDIFPNTASEISLFDGTGSPDFTGVDWIGSRSVCVTVANGEKGNLYLNGSWAKEANAASVITPDDAPLLIGNRFDGALPSETPFSALITYGIKLTATEISDTHDYLTDRITPRKQWPGGGLDYSGATFTGEPLFIDNIQSARVSLADETSGTLSNTNYRIESGSWKVSENSGGRYIECVTAGDISRRNLIYDCTFDQTIERTIGGGDTVISLSGTKPVWDDAGNNGYTLRHRTAADAFWLARITNGTSVAFVGSAITLASGPKYSFRTTRSAAGEFVVYILGGIYSGWTAVITGTDNTHDASIYSGITALAGDRLYLDRQFAGVVTP